MVSTSRLGRFTRLLLQSDELGLGASLDELPGWAGFSPAALSSSVRLPAGSRSVTLRRIASRTSGFAARASYRGLDQPRAS